MGNAAPKKLSGSYPDVEVYHVRNVWMHFQKAYSLGSGTFGLVFAANPKTSKISRAISEAVEVKHSTPVSLAPVTLPSGVSMESSRQSSGNTLTAPTPAGHQTKAYSFGSQESFLSSNSLFATSTVDLASSDVLEAPSTPPIAKKSSPLSAKRMGSKPLIKRNWSVDNGQNEDEQPKDDLPPPVDSPALDRHASSEASSDAESEEKGPKFGNRHNRHSSLSSYRIPSLAQRRERAQTAIDKGEAVQMEVAVKVMSKVKDKAERKIQKSEFANEIRILRKLLGYEGVVQYQGALVDKEHYCIVTEMCRGGELWAYMASLPNHAFNELQASKVIKRILMGLFFCHSNGICHLDLKVCSKCISISLNF
jgi:serine/threonine protein kinase